MFHQNIKRNFVEPLVVNQVKVPNGYAGCCGMALRIFGERGREELRLESNETGDVKVGKEYGESLVRLEPIDQAEDDEFESAIASEAFHNVEIVYCRAAAGDGGGVGRRHVGGAEYFLFFGRCVCVSV
mmetsp:Transcript_21335/g.32608  ORF Transcript_21335/g.32608 Transcript_21335/m.32608 type:complete len:128 (-) Transcript_21335:24-407(-)